MLNLCILYWLTDTTINSHCNFPGLFLNSNNHTDCNTYINFLRFYVYCQSQYLHISVKVEGQLFLAQFYKWSKWGVEIFRKYFKALCLVNNEVGL